jgi:hypothetical protein
VTGGPARCWTEQGKAKREQFDVDPAALSPILEKVHFEPDDYKTPVAELAAYLEPAAPTPTFR